MADDPTLQRHIPLVNFLSTQCVSSDESEDDTRRTIDYPRVYPRWRSRQLVNVLYKADAVAAANASIPIGKCKKAGTQLQSRPHRHKYNETTPAPPGLPRNCYDAEWLLGLPSHIQKQLKVQDVDYNFNPTSANTSGPQSGPSIRHGTYY